MAGLTEGTGGRGGGGGGGGASLASGAAMLTRNLGLPDVPAMIWLAISVPSALQEGQLTTNGMRPSTGSASKEYLDPHGHWILIVTAGGFQRKGPARQAATKKDVLTG